MENMMFLMKKAEVDLEVFCREIAERLRKRDPELLNTLPAEVRMRPGDQNDP